MPVVSGEDVLETLRQQGSALPVILSSGHPQAYSSPGVSRHDVRWSVRKPYTPQQLVDTVRDALAEADIAVPDWVANVPSDGFYREGGSGPEVWTPGTGQYEADPRPADEWGLAYIKDDASSTLWENGDAALLDVGDGVALFEFRSKSNSLGQEVITGVMEAIEKVEKAGGSVTATVVRKSAEAGEAAEA